MSKCSFEHGVEMKIAGIPVDPCIYEDIEIWHNVTVIVSRCKKCGHIELSWIRQEDTEGGAVDG